MTRVLVQVALPDHKIFAEEICQLIAVSAQQRGTGIALRTPDYIKTKIDESKAIIATCDEQLAGFCYIETWGNKQYVANSGLVVKPTFRASGIAKKIKRKAFEHSRKQYPKAKLFGLTTSLPVMKINSELGYIPVTYDRLTEDEQFWDGCKSCVNYTILTSKNKTNCICTAMLLDPAKPKKTRWDFVTKSKLYERFMMRKKNKMTSKIPNE